MQTFDNPTPQNFDYFGYSVAVSGDLALIGAHGDNTGASSAGSAYLYSVSDQAVIPLPASLPLLLGAMGMLGLMRRRHRAA